MTSVLSYLCTYLWLLNYPIYVHIYDYSIAPIFVYIYDFAIVLSILYKTTLLSLSILSKTTLLSYLYNLWLLYCPIYIIYDYSIVLTYRCNL